MVPLTSKNQSFFESVQLVPRVNLKKSHKSAQKRFEREQAEASIQVDENEEKSPRGGLSFLGVKDDDFSSRRSSLEPKIESPLKKWLKCGRVNPAEGESPGENLTMDYGQKERQLHQMTTGRKDTYKDWKCKKKGEERRIEDLRIYF